MIYSSRLKLRKFAIILTLGGLLITGTTLYIFLQPSESPRADTTVTTTTLKTGKFSAVSASTSVPLAESTAVATESSPSSTTNTTTHATTTTTAPTFSATSNASLTDSHIVQCVSESFTFSGVAYSTLAGTATWNWIRSDSVASGQSGTATFAADGTATGITPYVLTITGSHVDVSGWVALQLTWDGGTYTSSHTAFEYSHTAASLAMTATGC